MKLAIAMGFLSLLTCGCSATIVAPKDPHDPVTVYVADYGRHSGLILPNPSTGGLTEYAWGDWDWFALGNAHWYMIPRAMLFSSEATLGERNIPATQSDELLKQTLGAQKLAQFECANDLVAALREKLNAQFSKNSVTLMQSDYSKMWQVKDMGGEHYWFGRNCNHVTADWLKELDCKIEGTPMWSHFKLKTTGSESGR